MEISYDGMVDLNQARFTNNSSLTGGAISMLEYSTLSVINSEFRGNRAGIGEAGALEVLSSDADLTNVLMTGNVSNGSGGAISMNSLSAFDPATLNLVNVTMARNKAGAGFSDSSGIMEWEGVLNLKNSILSGDRLTLMAASTTF